MTGITSNKDVELYEKMLLIRRVEERLAAVYSQQEIRCPMHLCIGQEAIAAATSLSLRPKDQVFSGHRAHAHYLAKGGCLSSLIAELYGLPEGCSRGRGGSMHLTDLSAGFVASTPIVGGIIPVAVGAAWAIALRDKNDVVVVYLGDGCFEQGVVHESLNFAVLHQLPVVFICENNRYSVYTKLEARQPARSINGVAAAHGLQAYEASGNDAREIFEISRKAISSARSLEGPQFIEFHTHRILEHCGPNDDDELGYRDDGELAHWLACCPIDYLKAQLVSEEVVDSEVLKEIEERVLNEINLAFEFAVSKLNNTKVFPSASTYA